MTTKSDNTGFLGRGWGFPPSFQVASGSVGTTEGDEDIRRSLAILLSTTAGERVMQPRYGCNLEDLLFESLDTTARTVAADRIRTAILYFEPRIDVKGVEIATTPGQLGALEVVVDYVVRATNSRLNFTFPYYRNEGTEIGFLTGGSGIAG